MSMEINDIVSLLSEFEERNGLEFHQFNIKSYNEKVEDVFHLNYPGDTVAFCVLSTPSFFEKTFLPYINKNDTSTVKKDPLDQCISSLFDEIRRDFNGIEIDVIQDFEMHATRRPKVLVQTAGHVSGAAYYYQKSSVDNSAWLQSKIYGVSLHPLYGGWFSFRGVFIFRNIQKALPNILPQDFLDNEQKIKLLESFNYHWEDFAYREINNPKEKYSEKQREYFLTKPSKRFELVEIWCD